MGLVRTFVFRETDVAVDAVGAILHGQSGHRRVEQRDFLNQLLGKAVEMCLQTEVVGLVGIEPFPVVVALQLPEELDNLFHIPLSD